MSEKKYYVRLAEAFQPGGKYLVQLGFNGSDYYFDRYKGSAAENYNRTAFTKSELAEIMDGAIYKSKFRHETQDELWRNGWTIRADKVNGYTHWEWINPLIELVPVEDGE